MAIKKRRKAIGLNPLAGDQGGPSPVDALTGDADEGSGSAGAEAPVPAAEAAPVAAPPPEPEPDDGDYAPIEISLESERKARLATLHDADPAPGAAHPEPVRVLHDSHHDQEPPGHLGFMLVVFGIFVAFATVAKLKDDVAERQARIDQLHQLMESDSAARMHGEAHPGPGSTDAAHPAAARSEPSSGAAEPLPEGAQHAVANLAALNQRLELVETELTKASFASGLLPSVFAAAAAVQEDLAFGRLLPDDQAAGLADDPGLSEAARRSLAGRLTDETLTELQAVSDLLPPWQPYSGQLLLPTSPERGALLVILLREGVQAADLARIDFTGAGLAGYGLANADLSGVDLRGADLRGANLAGANLSGAKLADARFDADTVWPEGFVASSAGAARE
jgi:hypothetical protein